MHKYISLQDLIDLFSKGTKIHISVLFFEENENKYLALEEKNTIHSAPFCDFAKRRRQGLRRCMKCKYLSVDKVLTGKKAHGGFCINGIFEYVCPVISQNRVIGIVYVGNIIFDAEDFCRKNGIEKSGSLEQTLEQSTKISEAENIANHIANHISVLYESCPSEALKSRSPAVEMLKTYIDTYYSNDIRISQIARIYHFNEKYLGRLFIKQTGFSFKEYLNKKRLENACEMLKNKEDTVMNIALKAGFNNVTYFNRVFKEKFGITPKEYSGN